MKTLLQICVLGCMLILIAGAHGWEFNDDGNLEGWTRSKSTIDVNDGYMVVGVTANGKWPRAVSPLGPYDGNEVTGLYAKMVASQDVSKLPAERVRFYTEQGRYLQTFRLAGDPNQPEVVYVDLASNANWTGNQIDLLAIDFPHNAPEDYQMKVDWIRLEGLYLKNESFEYWDVDNDKIEGWTASAAYAFPDAMEPDQVNSREYAAAVTGTGNSESITQDIRDGLTLPQGQRMLVEAALLVPADAAGTEVVVHVAEQGQDGQWSTGTPVAVDTLDGYAVLSSEVTLALDPAERTGLRVEVSITSPAGAVVYLDDIFADVLPEPVDPNIDVKLGWPINCVKLSEGQQITIDGMVTPEEYAGAQAVVFNADTARSADPHDPSWIHEAYENQPDMWLRTSLEDYSATYYVMWDDENLYVAMYCQDDSYGYQGPLPNRSDCLQFTLGPTVNDRYIPSMYIPTIAPRDDAGNVQAKNDFNPNVYLNYDLFQNSVYAGHVDDETQNWSAEVKIPWVEMIGDFPQDLVNGDSDGDGKNLFPPDLLDQVGFSLVPKDHDSDNEGDFPMNILSCTHGPSPSWQLVSGTRTTEPLTFVAAPDTTSGLVAHWKLDEDQGDVATDSSGNEHHGTYVASPGLGIPGALGTCMDSSAGWMEADLGSDLPVGAAERTVSLWINPTDVNEIKFFNYGAAGKGTDFAFAAFPGAGILQRHGGGNNTYAGDVKLNEWTHLAMVVPPGSEMTSDVQVYINGVNAPQAQTKGEARALDSQASLCYVGTSIPRWRSPDEALDSFVGLIDDVRVYNRALSPVDLAAVRAGD